MVDLRRNFFHVGASVHFDYLQTLQFNLNRFNFIVKVVSYSVPKTGAFFRTINGLFKCQFITI